VISIETIFFDLFVGFFATLSLEEISVSEKLEDIDGDGSGEAAGDGMGDGGIKGVGDGGIEDVDDGEIIRD